MRSDEDSAKAKVQAVVEFKKPYNRGDDTAENDHMAGEVEINIHVEPNNPIGRRARLLEPKLQHQPRVLDHALTIPDTALHTPTANNAQMLLWRNHETEDIILVVAPRYGDIPPMREGYPIYSISSDGSAIHTKDGTISINHDGTFNQSEKRGSAVELFQEVLKEVGFNLPIPALNQCTDRGSYPLVILETDGGQPWTNRPRIDK